MGQRSQSVPSSPNHVYKCTRCGKFKPSSCFFTYKRLGQTTSDSVCSTCRTIFSRKHGGRLNSDDFVTTNRIYDCVASSPHSAFYTYQREENYFNQAPFASVISVSPETINSSNSMNSSISSPQVYQQFQEQQAPPPQPQPLQTIVTTTGGTITLPIPSPIPFTLQTPQIETAAATAVPVVPAAAAVINGGNINMATIYPAAQIQGGGGGGGVNNNDVNYFNNMISLSSPIYSMSNLFNSISSNNNNSNNSPTPLISPTTGGTNTPNSSPLSSNNNSNFNSNNGTSSNNNNNNDGSNSGNSSSSSTLEQLQHIQQLLLEQQQQQQQQQNAMNNNNNNGFNYNTCYSPIHTSFFCNSNNSSNLIYDNNSSNNNINSYSNINNTNNNDNSRMMFNPILPNNLNLQQQQQQQQSPQIISSAPIPSINNNTIQIRNYNLESPIITSVSTPSSVTSPASSTTSTPSTTNNTTNNTDNSYSTNNKNNNTYSNSGSGSGSGSGRRRSKSKKNQEIDFRISYDNLRKLVTADVYNGLKKDKFNELVIYSNNATDIVAQIPDEKTRMNIMLNEITIFYHISSEEVYCKSCGKKIAQIECFIHENYVICKDCSLKVDMRDLSDWEYTGKRPIQLQCVRCKHIIPYHKFLKYNRKDEIKRQNTCSYCRLKQWIDYYRS